MSPPDAARLLDLPADATPEQLETRFLDLRTRIEDKIAKAPTPGLKAKYRASLDEITTAFETLTLAADSSLLPLLQRPVDPASVPTPGAPAATPAHAPAPTPPAPRASSRQRSSAREFLVVAALAVLVLAGGGWWVMKTREEKAAHARDVAQREAAALKQKEAAAAEADRIAQLLTELRTRVAESRVAWEAYESEVREAERRAADAKAELRGFRDGPATKKAELSARATREEAFTTWLKSYLVRHPAKLARARAEQLIEARSADPALVAVDEFAAALVTAEQEIAERKSYYLQAAGALSLASEPAGIRYVVTDAYGRTLEGITPATLDHLPLTHLADPLAVDAAPVKVGEFTSPITRVRFVRQGWADVVKETTFSGQDTKRLETTYAEGKLQVASLPAGIDWEAWNDLGWTARGVTPATVSAVPPGAVRVRLTRTGYKDVEGAAKVLAGDLAKLQLDQRSQDLIITVAEAAAEIWVNGRLAGRKEVKLAEPAPGDYNVELRLKGYRAYKTKLAVKQEPTVATRRFSFAELSQQNITCSACSGAATFARTERCNRCTGRGHVACRWCEGQRGRYTTPLLNTEKPYWINCEQCRGSGREDCEQCDSGTYRWNEHCTTCGADGRVSKLDLSP